MKVGLILLTWCMIFAVYKLSKYYSKKKKEKGSRTRETGSETSKLMLMDINFRNGPIADKGGVTFEGDATYEDGFATIGPEKHLQIIGGLPEYMKHTGDQSWVFNFTAGPQSWDKISAGTGSLEPDDTGFRFQVIQNSVTVKLFEAPGVDLVTGGNNLSYLPQFSSIDMRVGIHSVVFTYAQLSQTLNVYFNGVLISTHTTEIKSTKHIDWSTSINLYLNVFPPTIASDYHRIAMTDRVLTQEEITTIYDDRAI